MGLRTRLQLPSTLFALAALAAALVYVPAAHTAPGDVADLAVAKTDSPDPVSIVAPLAYTIQVSNLGPQGATGVIVTDELPSQVEFISATASSGTCARSVDSVENDPVSTNDQSQTSTTVTAPPLVSSCRGIQATLTGTPKADRLVGTVGPDVIAGLAGNDVIFGLAGRDLICTGGGNDRAAAGSAADRAFGGGGADRLRGGGGPDLLAGNPGGDILTGNRGNDRLRGGRGSDLCFGGAGFDRIRGCER